MENLGFVTIASLAHYSMSPAIVSLQNNTSPLIKCPHVQEGSSKENQEIHWDKFSIYIGEFPSIIGILGHDCKEILHLHNLNFTFIFLEGTDRQGTRVKPSTTYLVFVGYALFSIWTNSKLKVGIFISNVKGEEKLNYKIICIFKSLIGRHLYHITIVHRNYALHVWHGYNE